MYMNVYTGGMYIRKTFIGMKTGTCILRKICL